MLRLRKRPLVCRPDLAGRVRFGADWAGLHYMVGAFLAGVVMDARMVRPGNGHHGASCC